MTMQEKINDEVKTLHYERKETLERFEESKKLLAEIIIKADARTIFELEDNNRIYTDIRRYAKRIEEIDTKLRVYNYLNKNE